MEIHRIYIVNTIHPGTPRIILKIIVIGKMILLIEMIRCMLLHNIVRSGML